MKRSPCPTNREALGCFLMLILGALMSLGFILRVVPSGIVALMNGELKIWMRLVAIWVVGPIMGIAVVAWLTYGTQGIDGPRKGA